MQKTFFELLGTPEKNWCVCKLEQLWWEWSLMFQESISFTIIYFHEFGNMLKRSLSHSLNFISTTTTQAEFLMRNQILSQCLDFYDIELSPLYRKAKLSTISTIRKSNQQLITIWDQVQKASSASVEIIREPGSTVNDLSIL